MDLQFQTKSGEVLNLTDNPYFFLINIDGQTSATSSISSVVIGGVDGDDVNNVQAQPRSIVLDLKIKNGVAVEIAKREILKVFKLKRSGSIVWTQNDRTVEISGIVESIEMPRWANGVTMQISLHCEQPFWEDIEETIQEISETISLQFFTDDPNDMLYFPDDGIPFGEYDLTRTKKFQNDGDVEVGVDIEIIAYGTVTNPILYGADGKFFGIGHGNGTQKVTMSAGDYITISTHKGKKSVKLNGTSVISKVKPSSTWMQLETGENTFSIDSDETLASVTFNMTYKQRYI